MSLDTDKLPEEEQEMKQLASEILRIKDREHSGRKALEYYNQLNSEIREKFQRSKYSWVLRAASMGSI